MKAYQYGIKIKIKNSNECQFWYPLKLPGILVQSNTDLISYCVLSEPFTDYKITYKFTIENYRIGWSVRNNWAHKLHKLPQTILKLAASH